MPINPCCNPPIICTACLDGSSTPVAYPSAFTVTIAGCVPANCDVGAIGCAGTTGTFIPYRTTGGTINGTWCFSFVSCNTNYLTYRVTLPEVISMNYGAIGGPCNYGPYMFGNAGVTGLQLTIARDATPGVGFQSPDNTRWQFGKNVYITSVGQAELFFGGSRHYYFTAPVFGALATTHQCEALVLPNLTNYFYNATYPATGAISECGGFWNENTIIGGNFYDYNYWTLFAGGSATITPSTCSPCAACSDLPDTVTVTLSDNTSWNWGTGTDCGTNVTTMVLNKSSYTDAGVDCSYGDGQTFCVGGKICDVFFRHNIGSNWLVYFRPTGTSVIYTDFGYGFGSPIHAAICDPWGYYPSRDVGVLGETPCESLVVS